MTLLLNFILLIIVTLQEHPYHEEKQQYEESRDIIWSPRNKRPERLRDNIKEVEVNIWYKWKLDFKIISMKESTTDTYYIPVWYMCFNIFPNLDICEGHKIAVACVTVWAKHECYFPMPQNSVPFAKKKKIQKYFIMTSSLNRFLYNFYTIRPLFQHFHQVLSKSDNSNGNISHRSGTDRHTDMKKFWGATVFQTVTMNSLRIKDHFKKKFASLYIKI